jgi:hypothetical protein
MSTFRDAIAEAVADTYGDLVRYTTAHDEEISAAVLNMPEMQAIRSALRTVCVEYEWCAPGPPDWSTILGDLRLPESVIAWVLDGDA